MTARIKTGSTTWADPSLLASGWYPPAVRNDPEARLRYYASRFPLVENDSGYWAVPDRARVEAWARETPPGFTMNMKAHALLTTHYTAAARLPPDLRQALPRALRGKPRLYPHEVGAAMIEEIAHRFHEALEPLHEAGKLGLVLFQFPVWFPISPDNKAYLVGVRHRFAPYRVAIELRNATWLSARHARETLELLQGEDLVYTCVDEPQGFPSSVPPIAVATSDLALVRMHGRNRARWARGARTAAERFEYRYTVDELRQWVPRVRALAERTTEVHVLMNNCHADYAVQNARQMAELLAEAPRAAASSAPA